MPGTLPDPVLALSMASIQKLNSADVDQLANLWNVFTKCKESLESGRRLENLSWRLWYREAHVLPPDTSLSDMSDFTPLGTPLTSRRSSINGTSSLQHSRGMTPVMAMPSATRMSFNGVNRQLMAPQALSSPPNRIGEDLSDPEGGEDWSDEDSSDEAGPSQHQMQPKQVASSSATRMTERAPADRSREQSRPTSKAASPTPASAASSSRRERSDFLTSPPVSLTAMAAQASSSLLRPVVGDRRRAVSSSSAFGSRARVKQANMHHRHRPLSFQQAVESLLRPDQDVAFSRSQTQLSRSHDADRLTSVDTLLPDETTRQSDRLAVHGSSVTPGQQRNSAPPCLEEDRQRSVSRTGEPNSSPIVDAQAVREEEQPSAVAARDAARVNKPAKAARFFVEPGSPSQAAARSFAVEEEVMRASAALSAEPAKSPALERKDSMQSTTHTSDSGRAARNTTKSTRGRGRGRGQLGLGVGAGRSKSGLALNRRSASGQRGARRTSQNRASRASEDHDASADEYVDVEADEQETAQNAAPSHLPAVPASQKPVEQAAKPKAPVKFHMGSLGSEDGSEEGNRMRRRSAGSAYSDVKTERPAPVAPPIIKETEAEDDAKSDDWASDTSEEWETEQKNIAQRGKAQPAQDSLFKKIPIRSKSAADLQLLAPSKQKEIEEEAAALGASPTPAVRGLLSSIFHPDDEGALRRAHASAADLRHNAPPHEAKNVRKTSHDEPAVSGHAQKPEVQARPLPMMQVGSFAGSQLKLSKSAVALPVLSTTGSRSAAQGSRKQKAAVSKEAAVFDDSDEEGDDEHAMSAGSASAVTRLNELARTRKQSQKSAKSGKQAEKQASKGRSAGSHSSLEVQVEPELDEEEIRRHRRTTSPAHAEPVRRTQSAVDVPDTAVPMSPRTTRRNMLRDELSESLRQNLLWERKSRNRMLGIGASSQALNSTAVASAAQAAATREQDDQLVTAPRANPRQGRPPSVLSGARLRPLTARSSSGNPTGPGNGPAATTAQQQADQQQAERTARTARNVHHHYTGDFHHAGW